MRGVRSELAGRRRRAAGASLHWHAGWSCFHSRRMQWRHVMASRTRTYARTHARTYTQRKMHDQIHTHRGIHGQIRKPRPLPTPSRPPVSLSSSCASSTTSYTHLAYALQHAMTRSFFFFFFFLCAFSFYYCLLCPVLPVPLSLP